MAEKKISALTEKTATLVNDDEIVLQDSEVAASLRTKRTKISNISAKVQADLLANDAVTEATVATDTVPVLVGDALKTMTMRDLMIQMKGYKEYTFAIRQSGTDAPTISVIKDDFGLETPLVFSYSAVGSYYCDISNISTDADSLQLSISNAIWKYNNSGNSNYRSIVSGSLEDNIAPEYHRLFIRTDSIENSTGIISANNDILKAPMGCTISIRQTLT